MNSCSKLNREQKNTKLDCWYGGDSWRASSWCNHQEIIQLECASQLLWRRGEKKKTNCHVALLMIIQIKEARDPVDFVEAHLAKLAGSLYAVASWCCLKCCHILYIVILALMKPHWAFEYSITEIKYVCTYILYIYHKQNRSWEIASKWFISWKASWVLILFVYLMNPVLKVDKEILICSKRIKPRDGQKLLNLVTPKSLNF